MNNLLRRTKFLLLGIATLATFGGALAPAAAVGAAPLYRPIMATFKGDACEGISEVGGKCGTGGGTIEHIMRGAIRVFSIVVGFAAVVVIIISGLRFVTSGGDASNVAKARQGMIYAIVGLVLVALSQAIVHYVLGKVK